MATFSFDYNVATNGTDIELPDARYQITISGDAGEPTRFEINSIMGNIPRATLALATGTAPQGKRFEIRNDRGELGHLRSDHYTWRIVREDGLAVNPHELQYAFWLYAQERESEPVFTIPRSALSILLTADKALIRVFAEAIFNSEHLQRDVDIGDSEAAARLVELGLIAPTGDEGRYVLMNIEVR